MNPSLRVAAAYFTCGLCPVRTSCLREALTMWSVPARFGPYSTSHVTVKAEGIWVVGQFRLRREPPAPDQVKDERPDCYGQGDTDQPAEKPFESEHLGPSLGGQAVESRIDGFEAPTSQASSRNH